MASIRTRSNPTGEVRPHNTAIASAGTIAKAATTATKATTKKDEPITIANPGTAPKRRGRPPKNGISRIIKVPSGRPRGRPKRTLEQVAAAAAAKEAAVAKKAAASAGRRGPGRPRKNPLTASTTAVENGAAAEVKPKRGRGRPRKIRAEEVAEVVTTSEEIKIEPVVKSEPIDTEPEGFMNNGNGEDLEIDGDHEEVESEDHFNLENFISSDFAYFHNTFHRVKKYLPIKA